MKPDCGPWTKEEPPTPPVPTLAALAARVAALESLVGERDARITALEKALEKAVAKIGEFFNFRAFDESSPIAARGKQSSIVAS